MSKDYVFTKNDSGLKFIGDFDGLYSNESNPWGQDGSDRRLKKYYTQSRYDLARILRKFEGKVVEVGCGLGYSTDYLNKNVDNVVKGADISVRAITRATELFPHNFFVVDIRDTQVESEIIILNEMLWYVMDELDNVINNAKCKYLIISQGYLKNQQYGKEKIDGFNGMLKYVSRLRPLLLEFYNYKSNPLKHGIGVFDCTKHNI
jgi:SAM-dependent methyltransferase